MEHFEKEQITTTAGLVYKSVEHDKCLEDHETRIRNLEGAVRNNQIALNIIKWAATVVFGSLLVVVANEIVGLVK